MIRNWLITLSDVLKGRLAKNAAGLYAVQISQFIFPLIVLPYLTRVLGPDMFGLVIFAQAYGLFLAVFIEYGFNMSGTRSIIQSEDDGTGKKKIYGIAGAQFLLAIFLVPLSYVIIHLVPRLYEYSELFILGTFLGFSIGLKNYWYYLAIERLLIPAITSIVVSIFYVTGIFLLVKTSADAALVLQVQIVTQLSGIIVLYGIMISRTGFAFPEKAEIIYALKAGWDLFLSAVSVNVYTKANTFILGLLSVPAQVGYFGVADKVVRAANRMLIPLAESFFPRMNKLLANNPENANVMIRKIFWIMFAVTILLSGGIIVTAPWVIPVLLGEGYESVAYLAQILSLSLPLIGMGNVLGTQWMIPRGFDKEYRNIILVSGILNILLAPVWAYFYGAFGMVIHIVLIELFVVSGFFVSLRMNRDMPKIFSM